MIGWRRTESGVRPPISGSEQPRRGQPRSAGYKRFAGGHSRLYQADLILGEFELAPALTPTGSGSDETSHRAFSDEIRPAGRLVLQSPDQERYRLLELPPPGDVPADRRTNNGGRDDARHQSANSAIWLDLTNGPFL
jgi:hypothetical protein